MNKEEIVVSAEVKTFLKDLYSQIEYELREDYKDSLEKTTQALLDIKEYCVHKLEMLEIKKRGIMEILTPQNGYLKVDIEIEMEKYKDILDIVNKAIGDDK
jgi:hypothetical protein